MKIQKNIRVNKEVSEWMDNHPLSNNSLVNYALHLLMQIEANAIKPLHGVMKVEYIPTPEELNEPLPF
jgi:hypothetical protein